MNFGSATARGPDFFRRRRDKTMPKSPPNHRRTWSRNDERQLARLAGENTPTRVIGLKMGRTPDAIYAKAGELAVPLKPTNQSPYNRSRK